MDEFTITPFSLFTLPMSIINGRLSDPFGSVMYEASGSAFIRRDNAYEEI